MPVNVQTFGLVESINQWAERLADVATDDEGKETPPGATSSMTIDSYRAFDLLQQDKLGSMERLLVLGLLSYCIYMDNRVLYSVMEWGLRLHCMAEATKEMGPIDRDVHDGMLWVAAILMATGGGDSPPWQLGRRIYRACRGAHSNLSTITQTSERYFWHPDLTQRLTVPGFDGAG